MLLGVHIIARNEADVLRRCLLSVKSFADEIVVGDTGQADDTAAIAKQCGARVLNVEWQDDFAKARNELLKQARTVWVLVLEADEWVLADELSGKRLRDELKRTTSTALRLPMQHDLPEGEKAPKLTNAAVRLFRADYGFVYDGEIYEQLIQPGIGASEGRMHDADGPLSASGIVIRHDGYKSDANMRKSNAERNLWIIEKQLARRPHDPFSLYNLGVTQCQSGQAEDAAQSFLHALEAVSNDAPYRPVLVRDYARTLMATGRLQAAAELLQRETGVYGGYADLHLLLGEALQAQQLLLEAKAAYEAAIEAGLQGGGNGGALHGSYVSEAGAGGYLARYRLADVLLKLGRAERAQLMYEEALVDRPDWQPALRGLAYAMLARGAGDAHIYDQLAIYTGEDSDSGLRLLARCMTEIGAYHIAMPIWRALPPHPKRKGSEYCPDTRLMADSLIGTGQYAKAAKQLMQQVQLHGSDEAAALDAALCWWNEGLPVPPPTLARIAKAAGVGYTLTRLKQIEVIMLGAPVREDFWLSWLQGTKDGGCETLLLKRAVAHGMLRLAARLTAALDRLEVLFEQTLYDEGYSEAAAELMLRRFAAKGELDRGHWLRLGELLYNNYLFSEALAMFEGGLTVREMHGAAYAAVKSEEIVSKLRLGAASASLQLALAAVRMSGDPLIGIRGWDGSRYEDDGARLTDTLARLEALGWRTSWNGRQRRRANGEAPEAHFLMHDR